MSSITNDRVRITKLSSPNPKGQSNPEHHVGSPPTGFRNPWPSAATKAGLSDIFSAKFLRTADKTNVPVPADRVGLVPVRKPEWGTAHPDKLKATWIGHASFLVETATLPGHERGIRLLLDPVFSERTSPVSWFGPKRYNPTPCTISELPEVDAIVISHNHYDHLDSSTIKEVWSITKAQTRPLVIMCGLGNKPFLIGLLPDIPTEHIIELDWWDSISLEFPDIGAVNLTATPAQHTSARSLKDKDKTLWCSWVLQESSSPSFPAPTSSPDTSTNTTDTFDTNTTTPTHVPKTLFFAGDTGYRHVPSHNPTPELQSSLPTCPAFPEIGQLLGPFDLALLPIGLYSPRDLLSTVHCAPEDSVCIHRDIRSKRSIGMHYGTVRGGLSAVYEDVLEPPARWKRECERAGLQWGSEVGLCDIGETVLV